MTKRQADEETETDNTVFGKLVVLLPFYPDNTDMLDYFKENISDFISEFEKKFEPLTVEEKQAEFSKIVAIKQSMSNVELSIREKLLNSFNNWMLFFFRDSSKRRAAMFRLRIFETFTLADLVIIRDFVCRPEFHKRIAESGDSGFVYETVGSKTIKAFSNLSILAEIIIGGENEHARFACISKKVGMLLPLQELNPLKLNYEFKVYDLEEKKEKKFWLHQASDTAKILVLTLSDDDDS